jgi:hypothetical protein
VTGTVLPGWGAATATGTVVGKGQTTATLVGAGALAQLIGVGSGGVPVGTVVTGVPITVVPPSATSAVGNAAGSVVVNSNQANNSVGYGSYTVTVPQTNTPSPTASVAGTIAGNGAAFGAANGLNIGTISGTATYNPNTGVINASPVFTAGFSVNPNGNTQIGCPGPNTGTTANLTVCTQTFTNGVTDTGGITTTGNLVVGGKTTTAGISNTGALSTTTLTVTGATVTNGLTNFGALGTGSLAVSGNAVVNGTLAAGKTSTVGLTNTGAMSTNTLTVTDTNGLVTNGQVNFGNSQTTTLGVTGTATIGGNATVGGSLGVTGPTTLNGATQINNTLGVTGATTIGSTAGTGGNTVTVDSGGIVLSTPGVGANSVVVNSSGTSLTGGGANMTLANGKATFSGANASPLTVTGIANGSNQFDAVNFGQFQQLEKDMSRGISGATAVANIPQVDQGKSFALGIGVGGFNGETAFAVGGSARIAKDGVIKASVGFAGGGGSNTVWGVGGTWNW